MKQIKSNPVKTVLTISIGFLVVYVITKLTWALNVAVIVGLIGIFSGYLSRKIEFVWFKLTMILSLIVPNIILGLVFYLVLFPIAILSRLFGKKDQLMLNSGYHSMYKSSEKKFEKISFENTW